MNNKKVFTIQINGIDTACNDLAKLSDCISKLDKKFTSSKFSTLLSTTFSNANNITKGFAINLEKISNDLERMKPFFEATNKTLKKAQDDEQKAFEKKLKKEEAKFKLSTEKDSALTKMHQLRIKQLEAEKKAIDEKTKKYGDAYVLTSKNFKFYEEYYKLAEHLYQKDAEKLKKTLEDKTAFEKKYQAEFKSIKHLDDVINSEELVRINLQLKEKEALHTEHNTRMKNLQENWLVSEKGKGFAGRGYIDIVETRKNYDALQEMHRANINRLKHEKEEESKLYDQKLSMYTENSEGWLQVNSEKQKRLGDMNKQIEDSQKSMKTNTEMYFNSMTENVNKMYAEFDMYYSKIGGLAKDYLSFQLDDLKDDLADTQKILDEKTKAYTSHKSKVEELEKEVATASGGRAEVLQEQIAREMAARDEALQDQKNAEKEKAEIQKQIDRKEKQKNKIEKTQQLAKALADQAAGVVKAWALGPIAGSIMAAITIATTSIQIAKIKREWDKLEDGGLLRGRRHSQGGMRIEGSNIEVEGDEFVVNRESTRKNLGLISFINRNRRELSPDDIKAYYEQGGKQQAVVNHQIMKQLYEDGGVLTNLDTASSASSQKMNEKILDAIGDINFRPVVSVVDITNAQESITNVKSSVGL